MKRVIARFLGGLGVAMIMMWSAGASAQSYFCAGPYCYYGPICPDAWGGCYYYTWWVGSVSNKWEEKSGLADVIKLNEQYPELYDPIKFETKVELVKDDVNQTPNAAIFCTVPGSDTCIGSGCGGSPNSSGAAFINESYLASATVPVKDSECVKEKGLKGGIKCSKTNTLAGLEGTAASFCVNANWNPDGIIKKWWPIRFYGTTKVTGPENRQDTIPSEGLLEDTVLCELWDPRSRRPSDPGYKLSGDITKNKLACSTKCEKNLEGKYECGDPQLKN